MTPPETPRRPVVERFHGVEITDPYRWLEGDENGEMTAEVSSWTDQQNAYTRHVLDNLPGRAGVEARLGELLRVGTVSTPTQRGGRYFYRQREGDQQQPIVYVRDTVHGERRAILDPLEIDPSGLTSVSWYTPSHDGELLAFGVFKAGDENSTLHILDVGTGEWLADEIPGKVSGVSWLPGSESFLYRSLRDVDNPYSARTKLHRVGTHHSRDPVLFSQEQPERFYADGSYTPEQLEQLKTTYGCGAYLSRDGRWLVAYFFTGTRSNDLFVADFDAYLATGELELRPILTGTLETGGTGFGTVLGDTMYLETTEGAPNRRIVAVDLHNPAPEHWAVVVPERDDATIDDSALARGEIIVTYMKDAYNIIERFTLDGRPLGGVDLPNMGSASVEADIASSEVFVSFASFSEPRSIYRLLLDSDQMVLWERPHVPVDPSLVEVRQVRYASADGTEITMFLAHKKGITLDGDRPVMLIGYGGFGVSQNPFFSATLFPWFEAGGVLAMPNLRGGGEYGERWHADGMLDNKQNVFDDFIAAAEWLIDNNYTRPKRLGISGGSNGGLLTGAALVQRPDLFGAVVSAVPLLDMLRYHRFLMARFWVPEYGSAESPEQFRFLAEYSPYHNIDPQTEYPAVLLTAGENDSRVHPLHARKMAARLQHVARETGNDNPVLLWVDRETGHGAGRSLDQTLRSLTDRRMFLMWQLGMLDELASGTER